MMKYLCLILACTLPFMSIRSAIAEVDHEITLGPKTYEVPEGFFYLQFKSGPDPWFAIRGLLPHLQPLSEQNADEFSSQAKRRNIVLAFVHYNSSLLAGDRVLDVWKRQISPDHPTIVGQFLMFKLEHAGAASELYEYDHAGSPRCFFCESDLGRSNGMTLTCTVIDEIDSNQFPRKADGRYPFVLKYSVPKSYLQEIPEIDRELRHLIGSFEQPIHP